LTQSIPHYSIKIGFYFKKAIQEFIKKSWRIGRG